jgi:iron complex outermembrane receptor protein
VVLSYDFLGVSWADINARLEMTYRDSMVFHPINVLYDKTEDQTLINARVTFSELAIADEKLTIAGWVRNLTDEEYREWGIDFGGAIGLINNTYRETRSYGIDLIYEF